MSKERLQQILDEYQTPYKVFQELEKSITVRVDGWALVELFTHNNAVHQYPYYYRQSSNIQKEINTALAKYIVQEEELRNKKFYLRMKNPTIDRTENYLVFHQDIEAFTIENAYGSGDTTIFAESDIEKFKEDINGFSELLELFEREYVGD